MLKTNAEVLPGRPSFEELCCFGHPLAHNSSDASSLLAKHLVQQFGTDKEQLKVVEFKQADQGGYTVTQKPITQFGSFRKGGEASRKDAKLLKNLYSKEQQEYANKDGIFPYISSDYEPSSLNGIIKASLEYPREPIDKLRQDQCSYLSGFCYEQKCFLLEEKIDLLFKHFPHLVKFFPDITGASEDMINNRLTVKMKS